MLRADCANCFGLCCVVPAYSASADFAITKPAGTPCPNLLADFRCGIHTQLRDRGFPGCTVYDCFGAGQQVAQHTYQGKDWRAHPEHAQEMFAVFPVVRALHELLWHLTEAERWPATSPLHPDLTRLRTELTELTELPSADLLALDVASRWKTADPLLSRASELIRADSPGPEHRGADFIGADLRRKRLRGANLRGTYLIGANLREADLTLADLIGADLRGAEVSGANLSEALFLTQFQVNAARGDSATRLPTGLDRPAHWTSAARAKRPGPRRRR
ncbi:pentapeptide repeat-containing protein [Crossiella sp. SN42]|uniref:pentapeptide repeat-containing protein n=1 Tax=Crossiella sp. SN42 TaxID=2944808 RepID=UPI00207C5DEC|nr:pentapeptide repeat-containing protein [Crossiella sp. SN42]MCO1576105.1 pentapeptide repeat-containing protein [Crossiella sp. SN42]